MFILDTNIVSELRKTRPHGGVLAWIASVPNAGLFVSAASLAEMQRGVEITRHRDPVKAEELSCWIDEVPERFRILEMGGPEFREWARLMHGTSDTLLMDAMIAATARVHRLTVATRNVRDFESFGVDVYDPFSYR